MTRLDSANVNHRNGDRIIRSLESMLQFAEDHLRDRVCLEELYAVLEGNPLYYRPHHLPVRLNEDLPVESLVSYVMANMLESNSGDAGTVFSMLLSNS